MGPPHSASRQTPPSVPSISINYAPQPPLPGSPPSPSIQPSSQPLTEDADAPHQKQTSSSLPTSHRPDRSNNDCHRSHFDPENPATDQSIPSYPSFALRSLAFYLNNAIITSKLGSSPAELDDREFVILSSIWRTLPSSLLFPSVIWSVIVVTIAYAVGRNDVSDGTLAISNVRWISLLTLPKDVVYIVGWALFVLLVFFLRESTKRHREAHICLLKTKRLVRILVRQLFLSYPRGVWAEHDLERAVAHLIAYPIALKMALRKERERDALKNVLHRDDVTAVLAEEDMHLVCLRLVRAYVSDVEERGLGDACRMNSRAIVHEGLDWLERESVALVRMRDYFPAWGFISHLRSLLIIWFLFLPLAVVQTSGWFTPLWTFLITYGIGMLFTLSSQLNDPLGYDYQDISVNRICAETALNGLDTFIKFKSNYMDFNNQQLHEEEIQRDIQQMIRNSNEGNTTPYWLEEDLPDELNYCETFKTKTFFQRVLSVFLSIKYGFKQRDVSIPFGFFCMWVIFLTFLTRFIAGERNTGELANCRWWCLYIPIDSATTSYIGLAIFLTVGFWLLDAHSRYWKGLQLFQSELRSLLVSLAYNFVTTCNPGLWHVRDRERILAIIAAIPFAVKLRLRGSRDIAELQSLLSEQDYAAIAESKSVTDPLFNILYGYFHNGQRAQPKAEHDETSSLSLMFFSVEKLLFDVEMKVLGASTAILSSPLPRALTTHLSICVIFWLTVLPLPLIQYYGFLSILILLPVGYSIINLLAIGKQLLNPYDPEKNNIPMEVFCREIKDTIHSIYHEAKSGSAREMVIPEYYQSSFQQRLQKLQEDVPEPGDRLCGLSVSSPTLWKFLSKSCRFFPSISVWVLLSVTLWTVAAVFISYGLSFTWGKERREANCKAWCSPVDVDGEVLLQAGFALFFLLAFRASDAIQRYEDGAVLIYNMEMHLRVLAVEIVQAFSAETWHKWDRERIIAHLIQVPLSFRQSLLGLNSARSDQEGVLSEGDMELLQSTTDPVDHCLHVVEHYLLTAKTGIPSSKTMQLDFQTESLSSHTMLFRLYKLREGIARAIGVKRFPVVESVSDHQHLFTALWLMLLPFSMAPKTGFYTIFWSPLISYGIIALDDIASLLVDPFGTDWGVDLPLNEMCQDIARSIVNAVDAVGWGFTAHITLSAISSPTILTDNLQCRPQVDIGRESEVGRDKNDLDTTKFWLGGTLKQTMKRSLYAHLMYSVPWVWLIAVMVWATLAISISFLSRTNDSNVRWWRASVTIDGSVGSYVSIPGKFVSYFLNFFGMTFIAFVHLNRGTSNTQFPPFYTLDSGCTLLAFMLLGFYVQTAFERYHSSGSVWGDNLRASCHALSAQFLSIYPAGTWHEGDHDRILAHIASIPIVLKMELRNQRNFTELNNLLSESDIGRLYSANSITNHCVDVLRSYFYSATRTGPEGVSGCFSVTNSSMSFVKFELMKVEKAIQTSLYLKSFKVSPRFVGLLRVLLFIWFVILPFVLAELSGWLSILWITFIAYAVLGFVCANLKDREYTRMYKVASEIEQPFGRDFNDLDLDRMAGEIVQGVMFIQKKYEDGLNSLIVPVENSGEVWNDDAEDSNLQDQMKILLRCEPNQEANNSKWARLGLTVRAVPSWRLLFIVGCAALMVLTSWLGRHFMLPESMTCEPSWCSFIAIDGDVIEYIGFALFFLLGSRLYDSHGRYESGQRLWREGIVGITELLSNRLFESYQRETWHVEDLERLAAHLVAFSVVTAAKLRRNDASLEVLREIMHTDDVERIKSSAEKGDYCLDVIRAYVIAADARREADATITNKTALGSETWLMYSYINLLKDNAAECERLIRTPLPYGYVQHIRIFLLIWLLLLPLGLVEETGWVTIIWVALTAYGVIGIERWANMLSNPFGTDYLTDLNLGKFTAGTFQRVRANLLRYADGRKILFRDNRPQFAL